MKIIQVYARTSAYNNDVERFNEDIEAALELHRTQYSFIMGDFSAKVRKKSVRMTTLGN